MATTCSTWMSPSASMYAAVILSVGNERFWRMQKKHPRKHKLNITNANHEIFLITYILFRLPDKKVLKRFTKSNQINKVLCFKGEVICST